ncbi:MAG TPA: PQQ-binding-like beta-propeller repeat protein [Vicinamibacteria bacterium]|nr:PQQ-binding-like beta-propeller repeat protein [Vicinamibacteria bacterium]
MSRRLNPLIGILVLAGCAGRAPAPKPPIFPFAPAWKTLVGDFVLSPLAADARRVYVATRDGVVRALDPATGEVLWKVEGLAGRLSAAEGVLLVRGEDGTLQSLHPRTGAVRWKADTGVAGTMPAVLDGDRAVVAGQGLAAVELASGRALWADLSGAPTTAPPVSVGSRLLAGEADGTLRCRDRATGLTLWTARTGAALLAPPLVDEARRRLYLGTTDTRILELSLDRGKRGWAWKVGADIGHPGLLLPGQVLFVCYDAVLYSLRRGGNLAWRGALPSRPLSAPLVVAGYVLVACLENELVAFSPETGAKEGRWRTPTEIRTPPLVAGGLVVMGLRDRSVVAYALPGTPLAPPAPPADVPPAPGPQPPPAP